MATQVPGMKVPSAFFNAYSSAAIIPPIRLSQPTPFLQFQPAVRPQVPIMPIQPVRQAESIIPPPPERPQAPVMPVQQQEPILPPQDRPLLVLDVSEDEPEIYKPVAPIGDSGHCCSECYAYMMLKKKGIRRLPSCHICHHYIAATCHQGKCLLLAEEKTCVDLSSCPSGHTSLHGIRDNHIARELRNEHTLVSKNVGTELGKDSKVSSSAALQQFVQMLADTKPERVENARKRAERWHKAFGNPPHEKKKKMTPLNLMWIRRSSKRKRRKLIPMTYLRKTLSKKLSMPKRPKCQQNESVSHLKPCLNRARDFVIWMN